MAKCWGVTALLALALLVCLGGTEVEAQGKGQNYPPLPGPPPNWPPQPPQGPPRVGPPPQGPPPQGPPRVGPPPHGPPPHGPPPHGPPPQGPPPQGPPRIGPPPHGPPPQGPPPQGPPPHGPPPQGPPPHGPPPHGPPRNWPPQSHQGPPQQRPPPYRPPQTYQGPPQQKPPPYRPPQSPQAPPQQRPPPIWPPQSPQVPPKWQQPYSDHVSQQKPYISKPVVSNLPPAQRCDVGITARIPCGRPHITPDECGAINCCYDGQNCYFGKAVTLQCTKDGQFIVVVARDATLPNIDLETISLLSNGQGCAHVDSNSEFAIYNFAVTSCGSVITEEPGVIIYENRMSSSYEVEEGPHGVITRDSHFELVFQCRYIGTSVLTVAAEVLPLGDPPLSVAALGPIRVELRLANGQCHAKGCSEVDVAYNSFYTEFDYPVSKVLRDPVYVEVQLLEKTDPNLVLTLGRCWATTSPNPHSMPQWDILRDGCPCRDDRYLSTLVPVGLFSGLDFPTHYKRFLFKMFTFVDPNSMDPMREQVYIHCSTAVCTPTGGYSCEPSCFRKRRDVQAVGQNPSEPKVVASVGPLNMGAPDQ